MMPGLARQVLAALLLASSVIAPAAAQALWGAAKYGMTEAGHVFELRFIFRRGALDKVMLNRDGYVDNAEIRRIVADLSREFTKRHGPEVRHVDRPLRGLSRG